MLGAALARVTERVRWTVVAGGLALPVFAQLGGCIVADSRCGENQQVSQINPAACQCVEGTVPDPKGYGCKQCGDHEKAVNQACECEVGYGRSNDGAACEKVEGSSPGDSCDADNPCRDPNPYCAEGEGGGFCTTTGCTVQNDCPTEWRCTEEGSSRYCDLPPTGMGKSCSTAADCAGTEATYCSFIIESCLVEKCVTGENACPSGYVCCDLPALAGTSVCASLELLPGGLCPDGKAPVQP